MLDMVCQWMILIGECFLGIKARESWAKDMGEKHKEERWEYQHSPFRAAAYALDPEFLETSSTFDATTIMKGLMTVFERSCPRDHIVASYDPDRA